MIYAVKNESGEIHIVPSLDGYDDWAIIDELSDPPVGPLGIRDEKIISLNYAEQRRIEYPPIAEQLDMIFHDIDAWKNLIASIKAKHPKC